MDQMDARTVELPEPSSNNPTIGRILYAFGRKWRGPRRADVTGIVLPEPPNDPEGKPRAHLANIKVTLDLLHDEELMRRSIPSIGRDGSGSPGERWFSKIQVYDPMDPKQRAQLSATLEEPGVWCEWMPYQKGQAAKNEGDVAALRERVGRIEASLGGIRP